jgi:recombination protein U
MNPRNQWRGRVNKAQGAYFEKLIETSCEYYKQAGTAVIEKTPEPFHITRSLGNGKFLGNFAKAAQPDFKGVLKGGRMIAMEAKHSANDRISQNRVTPEQSAALDRYQEAGALCFVLVSMMQHFFLVPWAEWKEIRQRYGRKYITLEELRQYERPFDGQKIRFL